MFEHGSIDSSTTTPHLTTMNSILQSAEIGMPERQDLSLLERQSPLGRFVHETVAIGTVIFMMLVTGYSLFDLANVMRAFAESPLSAIVFCVLMVAGWVAAICGLFNRYPPAASMPEFTSVLDLPIDLADPTGMRAIYEKLTSSPGTAVRIIEVRADDGLKFVLYAIDTTQRIAQEMAWRVGRQLDGFGA